MNLYKFKVELGKAMVLTNTRPKKRLRDQPSNETSEEQSETRPVSNERV